MAKRKRGTRGSKKNQKVRALARPFVWTMWNDEIADIRRAMNVYIDNYNKSKLYAEQTSRLRKLLLKLSESQNHRCCYCGINTWHPSLHDGITRSKRNAARTRATLEHVVTRSNGGKDNPGNLVMACHECNNTRNETDLETFIDLIADTTPLPVAEVVEADIKKSLDSQHRFLFRLYTVCKLFPDEFRKCEREMSEEEKAFVQGTRYLSVPTKPSIVNRIKKRVAQNRMNLIATT